MHANLADCPNPDTGARRRLGGGPQPTDRKPVFVELRCTYTDEVTELSYPMDRPLHLPWWKRRRWQQLAIAAATVLLLAVVASVFFGNPQASVRLALASVTIAAAERGVFHDFIPLRGKVVPLDTVYLDALEGGRVERVLAQAGDFVTAGQRLVELSNTELELSVLEQEGRLIESITQLQARETQLEQNRVSNQQALTQIEFDITRLRRSLSRHSALVDRGLEAQEVKDNLQDELDRALKLQAMQTETNLHQEQLRQQQLPQVESQLVNLQQDLKITRSKLDSLTVRAPVAGRLTAMDLKIGENRNRGERFAEVTPDTGNKVAAEVDEFYLGRVRAGQTASLEIADRNWPLTVARVYPQVKDGTFTIDLTFGADEPANLLPGQALQGKLALGNDAPGIVLPSGAFLERSGGDWAFVLEPNGRTAQRRAIKLGRRNAEQLQVLSGIQSGERVITSDYTGLERVDRIDLTL